MDIFNYIKIFGSANILPNDPKYGWTADVLFIFSFAHSCLFVVSCVVCCLLSIIARHQTRPIGGESVPIPPTAGPQEPGTAGAGAGPIVLVDAAAAGGQAAIQRQIAVEGAAGH